MTTVAISILLITLLIGATDALVRPEVQITFIVKDDFGESVKNVDLTMSTFHHWEPGEGFGKDVRSKYRTKTDETGTALLRGESLSGEFTYGAFAESGYYYNGRLLYQFKEHKNGRWEPWNPTVEIICKPILNPIPMYQGGGRVTLPQRSKEIGFDLIKNDFVTPYGKGEQLDFIFKLEEKIPYESGTKPSDYRLKVTFSNKGDGIQEWYGPVNSGEMEMPRYAPTEGYIDKLEKRVGRDKDGYFKDRKDLNYFVRVRTKLDKDGKIESAFYGKIVGNIVFDRTGFLEFYYYLNPTPLDVNMEHDPKKNLIPPKKR